MLDPPSIMTELRPRLFNSSGIATGGIRPGSGSAGEIWYSYIERETQSRSCHHTKMMGWDSEPTYHL